MGVKELIKFHENCAKNAPIDALKHAHESMCTFLENVPEYISRSSYRSYREHLESKLKIKMTHGVLTF